MTNIFIRGVKLTIKQHVIASDTIEYLTFKVHYESEEWAECTNITAYIGGESTVYEAPIINGEITADSKVDLSEGMWTIYVQGTTPQGERLSTNAEVLWVVAKGGVKGYPYVKVPFDMSYQSYLTAKHAVYVAEKLRSDIENGEIGGGGSLAGGGGCKIIGFTDGCDYIATEGDGYTAFAVAMSEAEDGDTILVMQGTYKGSGTLDVNKDISFIAVGGVTIDFPVHTQGGGVFSYENWGWELVYEPKHSKWTGFTFNKVFDVGLEANPDNEHHNGFTTCTDCIFNADTTVVGDFIRCTFTEILNVGHYFCCEPSSFTDCVIYRGIYDCNGTDRYTRCEFYYESGRSFSITTYESYNLTGCKIYAPNMRVDLNEDHGEIIKLNDTIVFAQSITSSNSQTITGGMLVTGTSL